MLSIVAKWWIRPGNEAAAVAALGELATEVEAQEPYTLTYLIHTAVVEGSHPPPPGNEVVFFGTWTDRAAFQKHLDGPVFSGWIARYLPLFLTGRDGALFVTSEFIDPRAGYVRAATQGD